MSKKREIKELKTERSGILFQKTRTTSTDGEKIAVSDWQDTDSKAVRQSRERLSEPPKKK